MMSSLEGRSGLARLFVLVIAAGIAGPIAGCNDRQLVAMPEAGAYDAGPGNDVGMSFGDTGIGFSELEILRVVPSHGPFSGGNRAILRGSGFTDMAQVHFGTHMVQPADHTLIDARRLQVVVPAGEVGTVDVSVEVDGHTFTLPDGYTYDAIAVDPSRGAIAGGTFVNIVGNGTSFATGDQVIFGHLPATDVTVVSPTRITCRTPAQPPGTVDVTVVSAADGTETTAVQAYDYYDTSDPLSGGLGGGPANGTINVTALNGMTGLPEPGVFVMVDQDLATPYQGLTDSMGQISFSGPDLVGQHTVHMAKHCFERTSFVAFDAQDVTAFLQPWTDPMCGMGGGEPPIGRGRNAAYIEGDLTFPGGAEFGPNPWDILPHTRDGWERAAYVFTTQVDVDQYTGTLSFGTDAHPNPDPSLGGAMPRVPEANMPPPGHVGYPYRILARPAGLAVFALAGLENTETGQFIPYVMGVARSVIASPGETTYGVNIEMNLPLDHSLVVNLGAMPHPVDATHPDRMYLRSVLDLGGEGVIVRNVNHVDFDTVRRRDLNRELRLVALPALQGTIADGRFTILAAWTSEFDGAPYTAVIPRGITAVDDAYQLPDFLGVPRAVSPANGDPLPADRVLHIEEDGAPADFHYIIMQDSNGNPAWSMFVRGDQRAITLPDLSSLPMGEDVAPGEVFWLVYSISVPGLDFDEISYNQLNSGYWSAYSLNYFTFIL
ncbi:MAG: IPT/TIG domain-containing protein [Sandaracinus sp.]